MADDISRRWLLGGLATTGACLVPFVLFRVKPSGAAPMGQDSAGGAVSVTEFRDRGSTSDTKAFAVALATGRKVYVPAGGGTGSRGEYLVDTGTIPNIASGAYIFGDGVGRTVIAKLGKGYLFYGNSGSADTSRNISNLTFRDLTLKDDVVSRGFDEHNHLVSLNGVSKVIFENVEFKGFRGDGVYIGSGINNGDERHNLDVAFRSCRFDGVNSNNRNAITIIDCDRAVIDGCEFVNTTRRGNGTTKAGNPFDPDTGLGMPGPIDCEPDHPFSIIRSVHITNCRFKGGGGNAISLLLKPNNTVSACYENFLVKGNLIEERDGAFGFNGFAGKDALGEGCGYAVRFEGNQVRDCQTPFLINGAKDLAFYDNRFIDCEMPAELGYSDYSYDVRLIRNHFIRVGFSPAGGNGLLVRYCDTLIVDRNTFIDCGRADGTSGRAIYFVTGEISRLHLINNRFESPTGRTTYAVGVAASAHLDRRTSVARDNVYSFVTNKDFG